MLSLIFLEICSICEGYLTEKPTYRNVSFASLYNTHRYRTVKSIVMWVFHFTTAMQGSYCLTNQLSERILWTILSGSYCVIKLLFASIELTKLFGRTQLLKGIVPLVCFILHLAWSILFVYNLYFIYVIQQAVVYVVLNNVWALNLILNIAFQTWFILSEWLMVTYSSILCIVSYFIFTLSNPTNGYNLSLLYITIIVNLSAIMILEIQEQLGSRFFLPRKYRKRLFDHFIKRLDMNNPQASSEYWRICMNSLDEPELEYSDSDPSYKWTQFEIGVYFESPWEHRFHPNWLYKRLRESHLCPVCDFMIPEDRYID